MKELFFQIPGFIVFLHVLSAVIWVGGMIAIRFAIHHSMQNIKEPKIKIARTLENLKRFFNIVIPAIFILLITAIIMIIGMELKASVHYPLVIIKEIIWTLMTLVFILIYFKRNQAQKLFDKGFFPQAASKLAPIAMLFIPFNIILGIIAIYLGVSIRGF